MRRARGKALDSRWDLGDSQGSQGELWGTPEARGDGFGGALGAPWNPVFNYIYKTAAKIKITGATGNPVFNYIYKTAAKIKITPSGPPHGGEVFT